MLVRSMSMACHEHADFTAAHRLSLVRAHAYCCAAGVARREPGVNVRRTERGGAYIAEDTGLESTPTALMTQDQRGSVRSSQPAVSPLEHGHDDGKQIKAFLSEAIFVHMRSFLHRGVSQDLRLHQASEPISENVGRNAECLSERSEAADPVEGRGQY